MRRAVLFDAFGTLFSVEPLQRKLRGAAFDAWYERLLHTAATMTLAGQFAPFSEIAESTLKTTIAKLGLKQDPKEILDLLERLPAQPEAEAAFDRLEQARVLTGVLTNGGERHVTRLLEQAGLDGGVSEIVSVEEVELYKPHPAVYRHAAERLGVEPRGITLVAAHAWDVVGAKAAGLDAIWVDALEHEWPFPKGKPRRVAHDLVGAVELALAKR
jgi:2-haloacid dehalogenase